MLKASIAAEKAYQRKMRYHHVAYIEDILSDIEKQTINRQRSLSEDVENKELKETLSTAFMRLTPTQERRALAYFYEGKTTREIATFEGVGESTIKDCIRLVRIKLKKLLKKET